MAILKQLKQHPLIHTLVHLEGNPKACVLTEPLWGIPYNLFLPFVTLYMAQFGLADKQIGFLLSFGVIVRVIVAIFGGVLVDKMGRRFTSFFFDVLGWSVPCLIWTFAHNFWWFFFAVLFNSFAQITGNSWTCLLVEDAEPRDLSNIFMWIYIAGLVAVFFTPLSGLLIGNLSLILAVRILYFLSFVLMTVKFVWLYYWSHETKQGKIRMEETKNTSIMTALKEYPSVLKQIFASASTVKVIILMAVFYVTNNTTASFFPLFASKNLGTPSVYFAYFPIIRAIVMLILMFGVQHFIDKFRLKISMIFGVFLFIFSQLILIFSPVNNIMVLVVYVFFDAVAYGIVMPRTDAITSKTIDPKERSRIYSVLNIFMYALASPFGYINGLLSTMDRRLPFVLNIVLFFVVIFTISRFKNIGKVHEEHEAY